MGSLLMRRREMVVAQTLPPLPTPAYELSAPTATREYDTGVTLFDTPKSFTILCEANFNNYVWQGSQAVFGISTPATAFRLGRASSYYHVTSGTAASSTSNQYTAFIMNNDSRKLCGSLFSRSNGAATRRMAVRYDHTTRLAEGFSTATSYHAPTTRWWNLTGDVSSSEHLKLSINLKSTDADCTVNIFKVYTSCLTDDQINAFLDGVI